MNDRQRVEALFFPLVFKSVLESGAERDEGFEACRRNLDAAIIEIIGKLDDRRKVQIMRRTVRVLDAAMQVNREGGLRLDKGALQAFYVLRAVLDSGYLELEAGSGLAVAIMAIVDAFEDAFAEARLDASARKQAAKMLAFLQREGFFVGVEMRREAA